MPRSFLIRLPALVLALAAGAAHAQAPTPPGLPEPYLFVPPDVDTVNGAIGVCVRWRGEDAGHVSDVVIAQSSGDAKIDAEAPDMVRSIPWRVPDGYRGEWVGVSLSFSGAAPRAAEPDCETLMKTQDAPAGPAAAI
jgi:hypothetical protein